MKKIVYVIEEFSLGGENVLEKYSSLIANATKTSGNLFGLPQKNPDVIGLTSFYRTRDFNEIVNEINLFKKQVAKSSFGQNVNFLAVLRTLNKKERNFTIHRICSPVPDNLIKKLGNDNRIYCVIEK